VEWSIRYLPDFRLPDKALADRGVTVDLEESATDLILREGFSAGCGARNPERVTDRLLDSLVAVAVLSGKITAGQTLHLEAVDSRIQFCEGFSL
jgi:ATP-dependent Clp protease ATP-binding subunit ClpB